MTEDIAILEMLYCNFQKLLQISINAKTFVIRSFLGVAPIPRV